MRLFYALVLTFFCFSSAVFSQTAADRGFAAEEFRRGVQSYYRASFNQAVLQFEKALSYLPNEGLIIEWLGKAYYRSGIEGAALQQWQFASELGYGGLLLENRISAVRERRLAQSGFEENARYVEAGSFSGVNGETVYFSQPVSALPLPDGTCWVLAYGSSELLQMNVNGDVILRRRGPVNGFDRPMDIVMQDDGTLLVSEFAGDRVTILSADGQYIKSFGKKGLGEGELLGPQYLAVDSAGNVYVTDFGNARVSVFSRSGMPLFSFGTKSPYFKGFAAPCGIAVVNDAVYVADAVYGGIFSFDRSGNYLGMLVPEGSLIKPEAMKYWGDYLLLADSNRVLAVSTETGAIFESARTGNAPARLTCAVSDINGTIWVTDFKSNELIMLAKMSELVGGLFVQIDRVSADNFPTVTVDVRVENRNRQPVVGLTAENFFITEGKNPPADQKLAGAASVQSDSSITLLIDRSLNMAQYRDAVQTAVRELAAAMNGRGSLSIVSAGSIPVMEMSGNPSTVRNFSVSQLKSPLSAECAFDLGIRLAAGNLLNGEFRRSVIFITAGNFPQKALANYGLADLTAFMNNNGIRFSAVNVTNDALPSEIEYLTRQTGGDQYYVYRPAGLAPIIADVLSFSPGVYRFTFTSSLQTNFGQAFLPLEVETYLFNLSGRDEGGYFAPLE